MSSRRSRVESFTVKRRGTGTGRVLAALFALPPLVLAGSTLAGIGMLREVGSSLALAAAACLSLLPTLALSALWPAVGGRTAAFAFASWLWCAGLLAALPLYFPGERAPATARALTELASPFGGTTAERLGRAGARLVSLIGEDADRGASSVAGGGRDSLQSSAPEPIEEANSAAAGDANPLAASEALPEPSPYETLDEEARAISLPYEGDERSLRIEVELEGPHEIVPFQMIFDTGATYMTLTTEALHRLDLWVPPDAPRARLRTANGEIEAPLVLLDAVWLGDVAVEWVTAAICEPCASPPSAGLLGLNVSREFQIALDHDRKRIELRARRRRSNRQLDIARWLEIHSMATRYGDGRVDVELRAENHSRRDVESAIVALDCSGDGFAIEINAIPARGEASTRIVLPPGSDCRRQSLELSRAHWRLDEP